MAFVYQLRPYSIPVALVIPIPVAIMVAFPNIGSVSFAVSVLITLAILVVAMVAVGAMVVENEPAPVPRIFSSGMGAVSVSGIVFTLFMVVIAVAPLHRLQRRTLLGVGCGGKRAKT
jgi:hypothetical protein